MQTRRVRRDGARTSDVPEEDESDVRHEMNTGSPSSPPEAKPTFLKGLFSVSTTSSRPLKVIRADIIRVLTMLGVEYREIKGGFDCRHAPSLDAQHISPPANNNNSSSYQQRAAGETSTHVQSDLGTSTALRFEIFIVKIPLLSMHGIQFKKVDGGTWYYKDMAQRIIKEVNL
jgi:hypothetical protein